MSKRSPGRRANGTFEKGHCPWRGGRRGKNAGALQLDIEGLFFEPLAITDAQGVVRQMSPLEVTLRRHAMQGSRGNARSAGYFLGECVKYGVAAAKDQNSGVVTYPADVPIELARVLVETVGRPPWTTRQREAAAKKLHQQKEIKR